MEKESTILPKAEADSDFNIKNSTNTVVRKYYVINSYLPSRLLSYNLYCYVYLNVVSCLHLL